MQRLEVSGAVRLIYKSLGVKGLIHCASSRSVALGLIVISTLLLQGLLSDSFSWSLIPKSDLARTVCF